MNAIEKLEEWSHRTARVDYPELQAIIIELKDGFIELPKDMDGEYIHIGDVMECKVFDGTRKRLVKAVSDESFVGVQVEPVDGRGYVEYVAHEHYHHKPTVPEILHQFAADIASLLGGDDFLLDDNDELFNQYAAKLQIREVDE